MDSDAIAAIRAFNRFYTARIGVLDDHLHGSHFTLPEARLLHELANRSRTTGAELARALGVDPAYVSRLLRRFVDDGLVERAPSEADRRRTSISLTGRGRAAYAQLDAASSAAVASQLEAVDSSRRTGLLAAMRTIRQTFGDATETAGPVVLRGQRVGDIGWLVHRQGVLYNHQFGWNGDFEALIAGIYADYHTAPATPPRNLWIAERDSAIIGSVFCMAANGLEGVAQLRMLYVEPEARGLGLGRLLVAQCVAFARDAGYERLRLWTHTVQEAARRTYARAGFAVVGSEAHRRFGADLVSEIWELSLR